MAIQLCAAAPGRLSTRATSFEYHLAAGPKSLLGNDDLGEMSSWAVFAYLGLDPEIPGRAELVLGSPSFSNAVVHRPAGDVIIDATAASAANFYIQKFTGNGKASMKT